MSLASKENRKKRASSTSAAPDPIKLPFVLKKVKQHPEFRDLPENEAKQRAKELSEPEGLYSYFSHLIDSQCDTQCDQIAKEAYSTNYGKEFFSKEEVDAAKARGAEHFQRAAKMPIKLQLTELSRESLLSKPTMDRITRIFKPPFGPLHSALVVGDVTVEWDDHSLVVPQLGVAEPDVQMDIGRESDHTKSISRKVGAMKEAISNLHYEQQIDLVCEATASRGRAINALIKVIIDYNCLYDYHVLKRNCQTFVIDAMEAMGINERPKMTGKLEEYFKGLKRGKKIVPDDFQTHEDLDQFVQDSESNGQFAKLTQHDKEYLLCLYFKFHLEAEDEKDEEWTCNVPNCMKNKIEAEIGERLQI